MPELKNPQDLAAALGSVAASADPLAELQRRGFTFAGDLAAITHGGSSRPPLPLGLRNRVADLSAKAGKVTVTLGQPPVPVARFAPDDYDIIVGLRLIVVDEIFRGLYDSFTIPHTINLPAVLDSGQIQSLTAVLNGSLTGIPLQAQASVFHIDSAPTTSAIPGTSALFIGVPFTLDFRSPDGSSVSLSGTLSLVVEVAADVQIAQSHLTFSAKLPASPQEAHPSLTVAPGSAVQPISTQSAANLAAVLQTVLRTVLSEKFVISPIIPIYTGANLNLIIQHVDVRTNTSPDGSIAVAGLRFAGAGPVPANPQHLLSVFPQAPRNLFIRADQRFLQFALDIARTTGKLDQILSQQEASDIRVDSARIEFAPNEVRLIVSGKKVNACLFIDMPFTATQSYHFAVINNQFVITPSSHVDVPTSAELECLLTVGLISLFVALPALILNPVFGGFLGILIGLLLLGSLSGGGSGGSQPSATSLNTPIPRTELLPTLAQLLSTAEDGVLTAQATAGFRADDVNTFIYARFLGRQSIAMAAAPLKSATVQLCDLDVPRPAGDDSVVPKDSETERVGGKFITTTSVMFQAPAKDDILATTATDFDGRVMITLSPSEMITSAGKVTTTITTESIQHSGAEPTSTEKTKNITERFPDLFFRVTGSGVNADTQHTPAGFQLNFNSKRLGSPASPLTLTLPKVLLAQL